MVGELFYIIVAVLAVSLISLVGVFTLFLGKRFDKWIYVFVAFAAGAMLSSAFFELIPESFEKLNSVAFVLVGIILFFLIETFIHWHHHEEVCEKCVHPVAYLNLIGDGIHNFLDGVIISASFLVGTPIGITTTLAICAHEIPQEIGDFAILIHSGMQKSKALLFNLFSGLIAVIGALAGFFFLSKTNYLIPYAIAVAAGSFIYIAGSDLFPELRKDIRHKKALIQIIALFVGIGLVWFLIRFVGG